MADGDNMTTQPLFFKPQAMEKVAGFKMPTNVKLWSSEIIRYLKSQHPYLPLDTAEVDLRRLDSGKGAAVGSVILDNQVAIPVIISRPRPGADPELAPMDVFFHQGRYRHLDPETINTFIHSPQVGAPEGTTTSNAVGGNPYVGDLTGDATPLEYSGQASPFAGPFSGVKTASKEKGRGQYEKMTPEARAALSFGAMGAVSSPLHVIGDRFEGKGLPGSVVRALGKKVVRNTAIGATSAYLGTKALRRLGMDRSRLTPEQRDDVKALVATEAKKQAALHIDSYTDGVDRVLSDGFISKLSGCDENDLARFREVFVGSPDMLQGPSWNLSFFELVARKHPTRPKKPVSTTPNIVQVFKSPSDGMFVKFTGQPAVRVSAGEIRDMFRDRADEVFGKLRDGRVFVDAEFVTRATWDVETAGARAKPVTGGGLYRLHTENGDMAQAFVASQMTSISGQTIPRMLIVDDAGYHAVVEQAFGDKVSGSCRMPSSAPKTGETGVFVTYVHGSPIATTPMTIKAIRSVTGDDNSVKVLYTVVDQLTGEKATLVPARGAQAFEKMRLVSDQVSAMADGDIYYGPGDIEWVRLRGRLPVAETPSEMSKLSSNREHGVVHVTSDGALWHIKAAALPGAALLGRGLQATVTSGLGRTALVGAGAGAAGGAVKHVASNDPNSSLLGNMAGGAAVGGLAGAAAPGVVGALGSRRGAIGRGIRSSMRAAERATVAGGGVVDPAARLTRGVMAGVARAQPLAQKVAQVSYDGLPEWEARELLVAMGMDGDGAQWALDESRRRSGLDRGVKVAGLHAPELMFDAVEVEPEPEVSGRVIHLVEKCRPGLEMVKAAAQSGHPETLDAILSLEFITPQNLKYFIDSIEDFDETASRIAAMLIAIRLGMPHVPHEPVRHCLEGLTKTVNRLRVLKSAVDHRDEQSVSSGEM